MRVVLLGGFCALAFAAVCPQAARALGCACIVYGDFVEWLYSEVADVCRAGRVRAKRGWADLASRHDVGRRREVEVDCRYECGEAMVSVRSSNSLTSLFGGAADRRAGYEAYERAYEAKKAEKNLG